MPFLDFLAPEAYDPAMMLRALLTIVLVTTGAGWVQAQSLAELARAEAARRKASDAPAKIYTNDDLRPDPNRPVAPPAPPAGAAAGETHTADAAGHESGVAATETSATPSSATAPEASPSSGGAPRDQAYWSARITEARAKVERSQAFAQALQNRIDMLWTDFVNRGDPVQQRAIEQERNKALAELERVKKEIADNQKAVTAIQDEARRAGVPPGWLRP